MPDQRNDVAELRSGIRTAEYVNRNRDVRSPMDVWPEQLTRVLDRLDLLERVRAAIDVEWCEDMCECSDCVDVDVTGYVAGGFGPCRYCEIAQAARAADKGAGGGP